MVCDTAAGLQPGPNRLRQCHQLQCYRGTTGAPQLLPRKHSHVRFACFSPLDSFLCQGKRQALLACTDCTPSSCYWLLLSLHFITHSCTRLHTSPDACLMACSWSCAMLPTQRCGASRSLRAPTLPASTWPPATLHLHLRPHQVSEASLPTLLLHACCCMRLLLLLAV